MRDAPGEPFRIEIADAVLEDLWRRLDLTRWPDRIDNSGWDYGVDIEYLRDLLSYWRHGYDWRAHEAALNEFNHRRADVDGFGLHYVHEHAGDREPLLLLHGWPGTFTQMLAIAPALVDHFDVVVVSLPGFGFSDRPATRGMGMRRMAGLVHKLMTEQLGYSRYGIKGTDLGAVIAGQVAHDHPDAVTGIHLSAATMPFVFQAPRDMSPEEASYVTRAQIWAVTEMAYGAVQGTKPQNLAVALNDSPAGLAGWIVEKLQRWTDCGGDLETAVRRDDIVTTLMIYWVTETIGSSVRIYYESTLDNSTPRDDGSVVMPYTAPPSPVPAAIAMLPADMVPAPRSWMERFANVVQWTEMPRGGHFPEWEIPDLLIDDIRTFFTSLPQS